MGSKSGPPPPDYAAIAEAEGEGAQRAINMQTYANRVNQENPWGGINYSPGQWITDPETGERRFDNSPVIDPATGEKMTVWTQQQYLHPGLQTALDNQIGMMAGRSMLGNEMMGDLRANFGTPFDMSVYGPMQGLFLPPSYLGNNQAPGGGMFAAPEPQYGDGGLLFSPGGNDRLPPYPTGDGGGRPGGGNGGINDGRNDGDGGGNGYNSQKNNLMMMAPQALGAGGGRGYSSQQMMAPGAGSAFQAAPKDGASFGPTDYSGPTTPDEWHRNWANTGRYGSLGSPRWPGMGSFATDNPYAGGGGNVKPSGDSRKFQTGVPITGRQLDPDGGPNDRGGSFGTTQPQNPPVVPITGRQLDPESGSDAGGNIIRDGFMNGPSTFTLPEGERRDQYTGGYVGANVPPQFRFENAPQRIADISIGKYGTQDMLREGDLGMGTLPGIRQADLQQNLDYSGLSPLNAPQWTQQRAEDSVFNRGKARIDPMQEQATQALRVQLESQGLSPGDEQYDAAIRNLQDQQNDQWSSLMNDSVMAGGREAERMFGMESGRRRQFQGEADARANFFNQAQAQQQGLDQSLREMDYAQKLGLGQFGNEARNAQFAQEMGAQSQFVRDQLARAGLRNDARSAGFNEAMLGYNQNVNDAYRFSDFQNRMQEAAINRALMNRNMRLNEMNSLQTGQQVGMPQFNTFAQAGAAQPPQLLAAAGMQGQHAAAQTSAQNQLLGGLLGGAASLFGGGLFG